jgi:hypothetical protein
MHEEVHERAGQQRQKNQHSQDMGAVLGEQKRTADDEKPDEDKPGARHDEARARLILLVGMVVVVNGHEVSYSTMMRPRNISICIIPIIPIMFVIGMLPIMFIT